MRSPPSLVTKIRSASRDLVRELGFMNRTLAGTDLPPSAVHAIIEIGAVDGFSAKDLSEKLLLEKSTVSRLVKSLVERKEVREVRSKNDARSKRLYLTKRGEKALAAITQYAERQVSVAITPLNQRSRQDVLTGLETYSAALRASRAPTESTQTKAPRSLKKVTRQRSLVALSRCTYLTTARRLDSALRLKPRWPMVLQTS